MDIEYPFDHNLKIEPKNDLELKSNGNSITSNLNELSIPKSSRFNHLEKYIKKSLSLISQLKNKRVSVEESNERNTKLRDSYNVLVKASDVCDFITENINLNPKITTNQIIAYANKISNSCQAPQGFNLINSTFISHPPHPDELEISRSYIQYVYGSYCGRCLKPEIDVMNSLTVQENILEMKLYSSSHIELKLYSKDGAFITYTLDGTTPTTHMGIVYTSTHDTESRVITITSSCTLKAICHKPCYMESELCERKIVIDSNNEAILDGAERPKLYISNDTFSLEGTPYTPSHYMATPFYTPFHMNSKMEEDDEENFLFN